MLDLTYIQYSKSTRVLALQNYPHNGITWLIILYQIILASIQDDDQCIISRIRLSKKRKTYLGCNESNRLGIIEAEATGKPLLSNESCLMQIKLLSFSRQELHIAV